jgi:hypothetical protein
MTQVRATPEPPSFAYFALMGFWAAGMLGLARAGENLPTRSLGASVSYALATHGIARIVSTETITLQLRTPFVDREYTSEDECKETPRGTGLRKAIGELVTCPYCCSTWAAALLMAGHILRPKTTRVLTDVFAAAAAANLLHRAFSALEKHSRAQ